MLRSIVELTEVSSSHSTVETCENKWREGLDGYNGIEIGYPSYKET